MARTGISYDEVELIAEQILQQGQLPTIEKIRFSLGTGSNSTISKYLTEWKSHRLRASAEVLPPLSIPSDPVNEAVKKVWQQLQTDSAAKMEELVRVTDLRIQTIQAEKQEVEQLLSQMVTENESLRTLLRDERAKTDELTDQVINIKRELAVYQEKAQQFEQRARHAETTYPSQLQTLLEKHQQTEQYYQQQNQAQRVEHQQALDALKEQMENIRHQQLLVIDELRTELNKAHDQSQKYQETITTLQAERVEAEKEIQYLVTAKKEQAMLLNHLKTLQEEITQLRRGQDSLQDNMISEVAQALADIPTQLNRLEVQCQELVQQRVIKAVKPKKVKK